MPDSTSQREAAAKAAIDALQRLDQEERSVPGAEPPLATSAFVDALQNMLALQAHGVEFHAKQLHAGELPFDQAVALAEVTVEAALNSLKHAADASKHSVSVQNTAAALKVTVSDDGDGFRIGNLTRTNVGVRRVILDRCKAFGIKVNFSNSQGTRWIFEVKHDA